MLFVIATLAIKPGTYDALVAATQNCLEETRKEPGCLSYDLNVDVTDHTKLVFVERWESRPALEAHFRAPHLVAWREGAAKKYVEARKIEIIEDGRVDVL